MSRCVEPTPGESAQSSALSLVTGVAYQTVPGQRARPASRVQAPHYRKDGKERGLHESNAIYKDPFIGA